ncbi:YopX family protein [Paenibacillus xylanilyticus]|uniref:YopX protein domain-containing protein n=1 Tax=Paenibacillus xylanilyticus TaxID=248903 RepID=A0A7Y6BTQ3_9BACL|nr:YopX family protein [Paenibacillus xylanilyticus]NUU74000.1 hypothetical protein [Paenibacillus xylanilyticus]
MNELKAPRAWYKPLSIMIQPKHVESINFETKVIGVYMEMEGRGFHRLRLSDFELMWPTGVKDQTGTSIYERDIAEQTYHVSFGNVHEGTEGSYDGHHIGEVVITSRGVCLRNPLHYSMDTDETKVVKAYKQVAGYRTKVIGNIYENPHLLDLSNEKLPC